MGQESQNGDDVLAPPRERQRARQRHPERHRHGPRAGRVQGQHRHQGRNHRRRRQGRQSRHHGRRGPRYRPQHGPRSRRRPYRHARRRRQPRARRQQPQTHGGGSQRGPDDAHRRGSKHNRALHDSGLAAVVRERTGQPGPPGEGQREPSLADGGEHRGGGRGLQDPRGRGRISLRHRHVPAGG